MMDHILVNIKNYPTEDLRSIKNEVLKELLSKYNYQLKDLTIINGQPTLPNHYISITNKDHYLAIAISTSRVGIDLEKIKPKPSIAKSPYFQEDEKVYLQINNEDLTFFKVFTTKECIAKITGLGIRSFPDFSVIENNELSYNSYCIIHQIFDEYLLTIVYE